MWYILFIMVTLYAFTLEGNFNDRVYTIRFEEKRSYHTTVVDFMVFSSGIESVTFTSACETEEIVLSYQNVSVLINYIMYVSF